MTGDHYRENYSPVLALPMMGTKLRESPTSYARSDKPMKLLVAHGEVTARKLVLATLAESDIAVVCAGDGAQAWDVLNGEDPPRMVVMGSILARISGLDVCRKIRERQSPDYTYIILFGVRRDQEDMLAAFRAGADDYLMKPIHPEELRARIHAGRRLLEKEAALTTIIRGWRTMLDSLPFGVACLDTCGRLLRTNKIFVELLGHDIKSLIGKSLGQTALQDPAQFSFLMDKIRYMESFDATAIGMLQKDGTSRRVMVWGRPVAGAGNIVYQIITGLP
jgi:PAS domain S-box-containing protein